MTELRVVELATRFWEMAGEPGPFPRDIRRAVTFALPLGVLEVPRLRLGHLAAELAQHADIGLMTRDRPLRAGLIAVNGYGLVFLDGTDPDPERRFSLAHETAHYLLDYWWPRLRLENSIGPGSFEVLDGLRPPNQSERIDAALAHVQLGMHLHLMERTGDGHLPEARIGEAERLADSLGLELLAPVEEVCQELSRRRTDARLVLTEQFGLPAAAADCYAAQLTPASASESVLGRLELSDLLGPSNFASRARNTD